VRFLIILALFTFTGSIPRRMSFGEEKDLQMWDFDSISPPSTWISSAANEVYALEVQARDQWNAHSIKGYLDCFWSSSDLLIVENGDAIEGFQQFSKVYQQNYSDPRLMGSCRLERVKVRMLYPDLAFVFAVRTIEFSLTNRSTIGTSTRYVEKFKDGWKIVSSHTSNGDL
jgi:hypothetical protein